MSPSSRQRVPPNPAMQTTPWLVFNNTSHGVVGDFRRAGCAAKAEEEPYASTVTTTTSRARLLARMGAPRARFSEKHQAPRHPSASRLIARVLGGRRDPASTERISRPRAAGVPSDSA